MKIDFDLSAAGAPTSSKYPPVPPDTYQLYVVETEERTPKNGGKSYLSVTFEIASGPHAGRKIWDGFYVNSEKPAGRGISRQRLAELAASCGLAALTDTDELVNRGCLASVGIEETGGYAPRNKILRYLASQGPTGAPAAKPAAHSPNLPEDDIPFDVGRRVSP